MALSEVVNIAIPERAAQFVTHYHIGFQDINFAGHLSNEKFLVIAEESFQRYLLSIDGSASMGEFWGLHSLIASAKVQFVGQGFYNQHIEIKLWISEHSTSAFRVVMQLHCEARELGRVQIDRVFFDYQKQRTVPCPEGFLQDFKVHTSHK